MDKNLQPNKDEMEYEIRIAESSHIILTACILINYIHALQVHALCELSCDSNKNRMPGLFIKLLLPPFEDDPYLF